MRPSDPFYSSRLLVFYGTVAGTLIYFYHTVRDVARYWRRHGASLLDYVDEHVVSQAEWPLVLGLAALALITVLAIDRSYHSDTKIVTWLYGKNHDGVTQLYPLGITFACATVVVVALVFAAGRG